MRERAFLPDRGDLMKASFAVMATASLIAVLLLTIVPRYETCDDITMMRIVSGDLSGDPEPRAIFLHPLVGAALAGLYGTTQRIDWYALHLVVAQTLSLATILLAFWRKGATPLRTLLFLLFFYFFASRFLILLQFTTTAFVVGFSGVLALATTAGCSAPSRRVLAAAGVLLLGWSSMIRFDAAALALLFGLPILFWQTWRKRSPQVLFLIACIFLLLTLVRIGGEIPYRLDPDWAVFRRYVANHGKMFLDRFSVHVAAVAESVGWSRNDIVMFQQFFYPCPETYYSVETTSRIIEMAKVGRAW